MVAPPPHRNAPHPPKRNVPSNPKFNVNEPEIIYQANKQPDLEPEALFKGEVLEPQSPPVVYQAPPPRENTGFTPPQDDQIRTIYVPLENAVNVPEQFNINVGTSFGLGAKKRPAVPSYDNPISSYDAPIYNDNSYTAPVDNQQQGQGQGEQQQTQEQLYGTNFEPSVPESDAYSTSFQPSTVEVNNDESSSVQELYGTLFDQDQEVVVLVPSVQDETVSGEVSVAVAGLPETNTQKNRKRNRSRLEASKKSKKSRKPYYRRKVGFPLVSII